MTATNGIDPKVADLWMGEALRVYKALDAQRIANMDECRIIRQRLPNIFESAKNAGLPLRAFKAALKARLLEQGIERLQDKIEGCKPEDEDDAEAYEMLQEALGGFGDTPLGAATLDAAAEKKGRKAAKGTVATGSEKQADLSTDAQVAANTAALGGIKKLPDAEFDDATSSKPSRKQQKAEKLDEVTTH